MFARHGVDVKVYLAGDLHHYRRHEETRGVGGRREPVQKITAGGGGAFLHPTHEEDVSLLPEEAVTEALAPASFALKATYPDMERSARLAWRQPAVPVQNPRFGIVPGDGLPDDGWLVGAAAGGAMPRTPWRRAADHARAFGAIPAWRCGSLAIAAAFLAFTDTHSRAYRVLGGLAHCAAHLAGDVLRRLGRARRLHADGSCPSGTSAIGVTPALAIFAGGWVAGSFVVGVYLLISVNVFGRHSEEAFSGLRIEDFKHFLRLHIDARRRADHLADQDRARAAALARRAATTTRRRRACVPMDAAAAGADRAADSGTVTEPEAANVDQLDQLRPSC